MRNLKSRRKEYHDYHNSICRVLLVVIGFGLALAITAPIEVRAADCATVTIEAFPKEDLPSDADRKLVKDKESRVYYYGIGVPVDYAKARYAAFVEMENGDMHVFGGSSILMMLYANGFGVNRNLDLSIKLACGNIEGAPAEIEGRMSHLMEMKTAPKSGVFDLCDDITSGYMAGHCAENEEKKAGAKRYVRLSMLIEKWPKEYRVAWEALRSAATIFFESRMENEVDLSGTARSALQIEERDNLEKGFLKSLEKFEKGKLPGYTSAEFMKAERDLNAVYSAIVESKDFWAGTITPDGVKATQKTWVAYRDAWVKFGSVRYPKIAGESWRAWLSRERITQLPENLNVRAK